MQKSNIQAQPIETPAADVIAYLQITADRFFDGSINAMIRWWENRNPEYAAGLRHLYDEALAEAAK